MQAYRGLRRVPAPSLMHRRRVLDKAITYVGLDVHKDTIAVALAEVGARGDVREYGKIANTPAAVKALGAKLSRVGSALRFCYEAGPCGYGIQRQLTLAGHECVVVTPSLIPRKPGDRIKTDRRDAIGLAKLHRAGGGPHHRLGQWPRWPRLERQIGARLWLHRGRRLARLAIDRTCDARRRLGRL